LVDEVPQCPEILQVWRRERVCGEKEEEEVSGEEVSSGKNEFSRKCRF
jgi:hypothetical protein